jgi:hypothetical protein
MRKNAQPLYVVRFTLPSSAKQKVLRAPFMSFCSLAAQHDVGSNEFRIGNRFCMHSILGSLESHSKLLTGGQQCSMNASVHRLCTSAGAIVKQNGEASNEWMDMLSMFSGK